jgi:glucose/arabinose dehydrogenase
MKMPLRSGSLALAPAWVLVLALALSACGEAARLPFEAGTGPDPKLPPPNKTLIPTIDIAQATGWPPDTKPLAAPTLNVNAFASSLDHPRWLHVLPNGDVLVAESKAPPKEERGGIKGWFMQRMMAKAGAGGPSANRITLLRDADGDGRAETRSVFVQNLVSPFGMALLGNDFYVATANGILRFAYTPGSNHLDSTGTQVVDLPGGPLNHHWTKNIIASRDGSKLYATVGSNSNVGENGMDKEEGRAAIWEVDPKAGTRRLFASGLRNPNGLAWEPGTGALWTVVNERDEIGSDLVPDYLTVVKEGAFYGWPYSYWGQTVDERPQPPRPDLVAQAVKPDYALGTHVAPLGLASAEGAALPQALRNGMFIGLHGSWNRKPKSGYKVVFVPFANGRPSGAMVDVLTGFLDERENARGRPVGVAIDKRGALLVADDVGNTIWRVVDAAVPMTGAAPAASR